jgi:hypothetical protein
MTRRVWLAVTVLVSLCVQVRAQDKPDLLRNGAAPAATRPADGASSQVGKPLVYVERGDLPIILSAPHGGRLPVPGAGVRTGKNILIPKGVKNTFTMAFDGNVDKIALTLADDIQKRTGHRPYVVIAYFSRRFVDANRGPEEGYEDDAGEKVWNEYHDAIKAARLEILHRFNRRGCIFDIHGNGVGPWVVIRGTANWTSDQHIVEEFGKDAITGPHGLLGPLGADPTYKMIPPLDRPDDPEYAKLNGGYITREYGSYQGGTFDAVQLELGPNVRKAENIPHFCDLMSDGIVRFLNACLLVPGASATHVPATHSAK